MDVPERGSPETSVTNSWAIRFTPPCAACAARSVAEGTRVYQ